MKSRILEINSKIKVTTVAEFITRENISTYIPNDLDYIVDAIDTVSSKLNIIEYAKKMNIKIISSMGVGNKSNPCLLKIANIKQTSMCPMARIMCKELRSRNIYDLDVCYSTEKPIKPTNQKSNKTNYFNIAPTNTRNGTIRRQLPASICFVPACAGLIIASEVIKNLINEKDS